MSEVVVQGFALFQCFCLTLKVAVVKLYNQVIGFTLIKMANNN